MTAVLLPATVKLREAPAASRGPRAWDSDTSTLTSTAVAEMPSVTAISMLSSRAEEPSCTYCRTFFSTSSCVKVSPFQNITNCVKKKNKKKQTPKQTNPPQKNPITSGNDAFHLHNPLFSGFQSIYRIINLGVGS